MNKGKMKKGNVCCGGGGIPENDLHSYSKIKRGIERERVREKERERGGQY